MQAVLRSARRSSCALAATAHCLLSLVPSALMVGYPDPDHHLAEVPVRTASGGRSIRAADGRVPKSVLLPEKGQVDELEQD